MVEKFIRSPLGNWALTEKKSGRMIGALCFEKLDERQTAGAQLFSLKKDHWVRVDDRGSTKFSLFVFMKFWLKRVGNYHS